MKQIILSLFIAICYIHADSYGQLYTLKGQVVEEDQKPVYGAQVFLNGTSKSVVSDKSGNFTLAGLVPGTYELVVSLLGYKPFSQQVRIEKQDIHVKATLFFNAVSLKEVVVQPDIHWKENYEVFKEIFLGKSANAKQCKILNPEVLNIFFDKNERIMEADSGGEFLIIENKALGYQLKYLLMDFKLQYQSGMLSYVGKTAFDNLKGSAARKKRWSQNRKKAYLGSSQHFLTSMFNNTAYQDGYEVQKLIRTPNKERPSDSLISANIRRLSKEVNGQIFIGNDDSVNYWINKRKLPKINQYLVKGNLRTDSLLTTLSENFKELKFSDCLYVIYTREREPLEYNAWNGTIPKPLDQPNYQVSIISRNEVPIAFDRHGNLDDPLAIFYEGYWAFEKIADMVPSDFKIPQ
ncbi:MAG TPA: carboxypeptidase-like regulatory domain-containing protein [Sphingobacteriaceae bacterium]